MEHNIQRMMHYFETLREYRPQEITQNKGYNHQDFISPNLLCSLVKESFEFINQFHWNKIKKQEQI